MRAIIPANKKQDTCYKRNVIHRNFHTSFHVRKASKRAKFIIMCIQTCRRTRGWYTLFPWVLSNFVFMMRKSRSLYGGLRSDQHLSSQTSGIKSEKLIILRNVWKNRRELASRERIGLLFRMKGRPLIQSGCDLDYKPGIPCFETNIAYQPLFCT